MNQLAGKLLAAARDAPPTPLENLIAGGPILVLTPHPDDESLGCGGLMAACAATGITVHVVLLTDGAGSHVRSASYPPPRLTELRLHELRAALAELGIPAESLTTLHWPDAAAPSDGPGFARATAQVATAIRQSGAAAIFSTWSNDPHCDHAAAARIAQAAASHTGIRHFAYPVWGWTLPPHQPVSAGPAHRLDIAKFLAAKQRAVACHRSQLGSVIHDAAQAFTLPQKLLDACLTDSEIFFDESPA